MGINLLTVTRAAQLQILASEDNVKTLLLSMSAQLANQYFPCPGTACPFKSSENPEVPL